MRTSVYASKDFFIVRSVPLQHTPSNEDKLISRRAYERNKKHQENRRPWSSSNRMQYLRLSRGLRKPTEQEMRLYQYLKDNQSASIDSMILPRKNALNAEQSFNIINENKSEQASNEKSAKKRMKSIYITTGSHRPTKKQLYTRVQTR